MARNKHLSGIQHALMAATRRLPDSRGKDLVELSVLWESIVREPLLGCTCVMDCVPGDAICIELTNPAWKEVIRASARYILREIRERSGGRLRFNRILVSPGRRFPERTPGEPSDSRHAVIPEDLEREIREIHDERLRESLRKLYDAIASTGQS